VPGLRPTRGVGQRPACARVRGAGSRRPSAGHTPGAKKSSPTGGPRASFVLGGARTPLETAASPRRKSAVSRFHKWPSDRDNLYFPSPTRPQMAPGPDP
jgi:hypothetical protein